MVYLGYVVDVGYFVYFDIWYIWYFDILDIWYIGIFCIFGIFWLAKFCILFLPGGLRPPDPPYNRPPASQIH